MNHLTIAIQEALERQLKNSAPGFEDRFEGIGIVPIPAHGDRIVKLRTLEEALEEETIGYLIQLKTKKTVFLPRENTGMRLEPENIHLPNGKLNITYLLKTSDLLYGAGEYLLARNVYKKLLSSGERTALAFYGIGRCYEAEGLLEKAKVNYEESIAYQATLEAYQSLASVLTRQKKDRKAAETLERALNLKEIPTPTRFELHLSCGDRWARAEKPENAEKHYKKALEINPSAREIHSNLGAICLQGGRVPEARRHFQEALASNPKNDKALAGLGSCALNEGEKRLAHDYFAKALEIELNNPSAIYHLVRCAYEIKSYATAARLVEDYTHAAPVNANLLYSLAGLQYHLGRMAEAKATAQKLLQLDPEHSGARELLGMIEQFGASSC